MIWVEDSDNTVQGESQKWEYVREKFDDLDSVVFRFQDDSEKE